MEEVAIVNIAVVRGILSRPLERRVLASGATVAQLDVTVVVDGAPNETVPVAWVDAPAAVDTWEPGDELVVVGRVRRRFFRTGQGTASRTELVASSVVRARDRRRVRALLAAAAAELTS
jgi:hypothetical protein